MKLKRFNEFNIIKESKLNINNVKDQIEDFFKENDGEVTNDELKSFWDGDQEIFDLALDQLINDAVIKTEDGKNWCWCDMVQENVNESVSKEDEEKYLSPKQRKLPEGLKKAIIARAKKAKKKDKKE